MWLELDLEAKDDAVVVGARGSRGERPPAHRLEPTQGPDAMQSFANKVARAARAGRPLDPAAVEAAQALHAAVLAVDVRDVLSRMSEAAKDDAILLRVFTNDRSLAAVPWEVLCRPGTTEGFLGTEPRLFVARGVHSPDPWEPREVRGAVGVLAIAPGEGEGPLLALREALGPAIDAGEVEWLDPIAGPSISARVLYDRLRRGTTPHIVHFIGHGGVDMSGRPVLRLADDEEGEEVWITAEARARELGASFADELRLVVLEACEGAKAGALGSAAEVLARAGADAVVAHLWPVKANVARTASMELYRSITGAERSRGDVGRSLAAVRRTLLADSAEAFSPVAYLRGSSSHLVHARALGARRRARRARPAGRARDAALPARSRAVHRRAAALQDGVRDPAPGHERREAGRRQARRGHERLENGARAAEADRSRAGDRRASAW